MRLRPCACASDAMEPVRLSELARAPARFHGCWREMHERDTGAGWRKRNTGQRLVQWSGGSG